MTFQYRLTRVGRYWAKLYWTGEGDPVVNVLLRRIQGIPGVTLGPNTCELPITSWALADVVALEKAAGIELPLIWDHDNSSEFAFSRPLFEHQLEAASQILTRPGFLLADDMGLGKSASAIAAAAALRTQDFQVGFRAGRPALIIGPLFVRDVWKQELSAMGVLGNGFHAFKGKDTMIPFPKDASWYFCHYDVLEAWWQQIYKLRPIVGIGDEAHWFKNPKSSRSKGALMALGALPNRILLTGTPLDNAPGDLWNLLTVATGPGTWGSHTQFRQRYAGAVSNGFGQEDTEPTHVEELRQRMAPFYLRRTIKDTAHVLPEFIRRTQLVELDAAAVRKHEKILSASKIEFLVRALMRGNLSEDVLQTLNKLRTITSAGKIKHTIELANNLLEQGESVVIWTWTRAAAYKIALGLKYTGLHVTGEMDQDERTKAVDTFQCGTGLSLVATYGTLREGVTLHAARFSIHHDLDYKLTSILQAERRIYRIGQKRACQAIWMLAQNSFDTMLAALLQKKADAMSTMLGIEEGISELDLEGVLGVESFESQVSSALKMWELS